MKNELAKNLKELRKSMNLTQQKLADQIGITQRAYAFYEKGDREPTLNTLINLSIALNVSIDRLVLPRERENEEEEKAKGKRKRGQSCTTSPSLAVENISRY